MRPELPTAVAVDNSASIQPARSIFISWGKSVQISGATSDEALPVEFQATSSAIKFIPEQFRKSLPPDKEVKNEKSKKLVTDIKRLKVNAVKPKKLHTPTQSLPAANDKKIPTAMELAFQKAEQPKN